MKGQVALLWREEEGQFLLLNDLSDFHSSLIMAMIEQAQTVCTLDSTFSIFYT